MFSSFGIELSIPEAILITFLQQLMIINLLRRGKPRPVYFSVQITGEVFQLYHAGSMHASSRGDPYDILYFKTSFSRNDNTLLQYSVSNAIFSKS